MTCKQSLPEIETESNGLSTPACSVAHQWVLFKRREVDSGAALAFSQISGSYCDSQYERSFIHIDRRTIGPSVIRTQPKCKIVSVFRWHLCVIDHNGVERPPD